MAQKKEYKKPDPVEQEKEAQRFNILAERKEDAIARIARFLNGDAAKSRMFDAMGGIHENRAKLIARGVIATLQKAEPDNKGIALWMCREHSILESIIDSIMHDIPIDGRGLAYLVRYNMEVKFSPGYKGYIHKVRKHNPTVDIQVKLVFKGDDFSFNSRNGTDTYEHIERTPFPSKNDMENNLIGCYAFISYDVMPGTGQWRAKIERLSVDDILMIRSKAKTRNVWDEFFSEQIKKAAVRRGLKIPFASIIEKLDEVDNEHFEMGDVTGAGSIPQDKKDAWEENLAAERAKHAGGKPTDEGDATPKGETIDGEAVKVEEEEAGADSAEGAASGFGWDGTLQIPYMPAVDMAKVFDTPKEAYAELVLAMGATESKAERHAVIEANMPLIGALLKEKNLSAVEELHKLADRGE